MLGSHTRRLLELLDRYGEVELDAALRDCLGRPASASPRASATVPVVLPDDERIRDLDVEPHDLADYDDLADQEDDDHDDHE